VVWARIPRSELMGAFGRPMSVNTRTRHTEIQPHSTRCPLEEKSKPWREALGLSDHEEIGIVLQGMRIRAGMTQKELAERLGAKQHHVSEMGRAHRSIGKEMAQRLA
jgi:DNA-binding XRE family transcriptional regulator